MSRPMKDSGIEWIGEIPENWTIARLKDIASNETYSIVDGPFGTAISTSDYKDCGVPLVRIVNLNQTELKTDNFVFITEEHAEKLSRSRFFKEDIIFAKTGATVGKCAFNSNVENGILSSSCVKIRISNTFCRKYYYYYFNTNQFNEALRLSCNGTTRDTINLKPFSCLYCIIPPLPEQLAISAYLDEKCALIDSVIEKTKASIEEYKKLRQAVITQAVTKGIRGNRPMKDSGIAWIGEIPQEWFSIKMKYMMYIRARLGWKGLKADEYVDEGYTFIGTPNIDETGKIDWKNVYYITKERYEESPEIMLSKGDVLLTKDGAGIGKCAYIDVLPTEATTNSSLAVITCNNLLNGKYLFYYFKSYYFQKYIDQLKAGMGVPHLFQGDLREIIIPVPKINEQQEIADYLDKKCAEIDTLITKKEQFLKELESYKKSLIYEYVTGKKEVQA